LKRQNNNLEKSLNQYAGKKLAEKGGKNSDSTAIVDESR